MNTTDSIKAVKPVCEMPEEEAAKLPRADTRERHNNHGTVNTSDILEPPAMVYIDEPDPEIVQELSAAGYYAVTAEGGAYEATPVDSFIVFDDGSFYGADGEGADLAEMPGFQGYIFVRGDVDGMTSEQVKQMLKESRIDKED